MISARGMGKILALACLLAACDSERTAGGSVETENVTALVVSVDSIAPLARQMGWVPMVATVRLDARTFDFDHADTNGDNLVVETMAGEPIAFAIHHWNSRERWARIEVRLEGDLLRKGAHFRLRNGARSLTLSDSGAVWAKVPDKFREQWTSVLVDDFEHGDLHTLLPDDSTWYTRWSDTAAISVPTLVPAEGGRTGTAIRFDYNAPALSGGYVLVGTTLASHPVNFGSLDSIVLYARGRGILSVSLDHHWAGGDSKTWMHDSLDSNWTRWRIRPQDFDVPNGVAGNLGWSAVHDSVTTLSIFAAGSGTVMLDDIRLFGMQYDDFE